MSQIVETARAWRATPLFRDFAEAWTPVMFSAELVPERPRRVTVAGTSLVLFRAADRQPVALLDRCPHRGAALSLGTVVQGSLECPFHGWRFDALGRVTHVPWNPDAKCHRLHASRVPTHEVGGQVWIHTSLQESPTEKPSIDPWLEEPGVHSCGTTVQWNTHWTRAMENMLDWPHLAFVHRRTIGRSHVPRSGGRMDIHREEHPWGLRTYVSIDGERLPGALDYRRPNRMNLHLVLMGRKLLLGVACVPVDARRTRLLLSTSRAFLAHPVFDWLFNRANRRISAEDQAIVESSAPMCVPPAGDEASVRTDAITLRFRKDYFARLKGSAVVPGHVSFRTSAQAHGSSSDGASRRS